MLIANFQKGNIILCMNYDIGKWSAFKVLSDLNIIGYLNDNGHYDLIAALNAYGHTHIRAWWPILSEQDMDVMRDCFMDLPPMDYLSLIIENPGIAGSSISIGLAERLLFATSQSMRTGNNNIVLSDSDSDELIEFLVR